MTVNRSPLHVTDDGEVPFTKPVKGVAATDPSHLATLAQATGGGAAWGAITGTLSAQTDLHTALNAKAPTASPTFTGTALFNIAGSTVASTANVHFARMQELADSQAAQDGFFLGFLSANYLPIGGAATALAMATARMLGRTAGGSGAVQEMSDADVRSFLGLGALALMSAINLATQVTGTLPIANGGTGASSGPAAISALGAAAASHTHAGTDASIDDTGFTGALSGASVTTLQKLAEWIDNNITP